MHLLEIKKMNILSPLIIIYILSTYPWIMDTRHISLQAESYFCSSEAQLKLSFSDFSHSVSLGLTMLSG